MALDGSGLSPDLWTGAPGHYLLISIYELRGRPPRSPIRITLVDCAPGRLMKRSAAPLCALGSAPPVAHVDLRRAPPIDAAPPAGTRGPLRLLICEGRFSIQACRVYLGDGAGSGARCRLYRALGSFVFQTMMEPRRTRAVIRNKLAD